MADNYAFLRYEGLSVANWDSIMDKYQSFGGAGASVTMAEGRAADGWLQINAGGPNAFGYTTALKAQISAQIGPDPVGDAVQTMGNARTRTGNDIREFGRE